jgi:acyl-CoA synthetase (AMP-forming)/AMP-acid ligase II
MIGGSSCPDTLLKRMESRLGATVQTSWGMTELSPQGTISPRSDRPAWRGVRAVRPWGWTCC